MNQMNHMNGWSNAWGGGWMWVIGGLVLVLLFYIISKMGKKEPK